MQTHTHPPTNPPTHTHTHTNIHTTPKYPYIGWALKTSRVTNTTCVPEPIMIFIAIVITIMIFMGQLK